MNIKQSNCRLLWYTLFVAIVLMTSCDHNADENNSSPNQTRLCKKWELMFASLDGQDVTGFYTGLSITFDPKVIIAENGLSPIWKPSIEYAFVSDGSEFTLTRADGIEMTATFVGTGDSHLNIKFNYTANSGGRLSEISGKYSFEFSAK